MSQSRAAPASTGVHPPLISSLLNQPRRVAVSRAKKQKGLPALIYFASIEIPDISPRISRAWCGLFEEDAMLPLIMIMPLFYCHLLCPSILFHLILTTASQQSTCKTEAQRSAGIVLVSEIKSGRARHPNQLCLSRELCWLSLPRTTQPELCISAARFMGSGSLKAIGALVTPLGFPGLKTKLKYRMEHFASV